MGGGVRKEARASVEKLLSLPGRVFGFWLRHGERRPQKSRRDATPAMERHIAVLGVGLHPRSTSAFHFFTEPAVWALSLARTIVHTPAAAVAPFPARLFQRTLPALHLCTAAVDRSLKFVVYKYPYPGPRLSSN